MSHYSPALRGFLNWCLTNVIHFTWESNLTVSEVQFSHCCCAMYKWDELRPVQSTAHRLQDCFQSSAHICWADISIFSWHKYIPCKFSNAAYRVATDIHLKEKCDHVSFPDLDKPSLIREKYPSFHSHALCMSSLFDSTYICEQLFWRINYRESKIS